MATSSRLRRTRQDRLPADTARTLVLVDDAERSFRLTGRRLRVWHRALARFAGPFQDGGLAAGRSPDGGRLRAARARALVAPAYRTRLARDWENLLRAARERPTPLDVRAPLCRRRILAAETDIVQLACALRAPLPVPVRGVAMAAMLLTDGSGPVYNRACATDLGAAVHEAISRMDPWTALTGPASDAPSDFGQGSASLR